MRRLLYSFSESLSPAVTAKLSLLKFRLLSGRKKFESNPESNVIVSLTTFPARAAAAWIPIECIFQQDFKPAKVVLVLSEKQFPGRKIPMSLRRQERRGLEILWTAGEMGSYKKLLPTSQKYPYAHIVTFDDDIWVQRWRLGELVRAASQDPRAIVGHRGWEIRIENGKLMPYCEWPPATKTTPRGAIFLTGAGGIFYPAGVLPKDVLCDYETAAKLAPNADDIWFWAVARYAGIPSKCLGVSELDPVQEQEQTPKLETVNRGGGKNDQYFSAVMKHFDLSASYIADGVDHE